jgi:hypothetical protein
LFSTADSLDSCFPRARVAIESWFRFRLIKVFRAKNAPCISYVRYLLKQRQRLVYRLRMHVCFHETPECSCLRDAACDREN